MQSSRVIQARALHLIEPLYQTGEFVTYFMAKCRDLTSLRHAATNFITIIDFFVIFHHI